MSDAVVDFAIIGGGASGIYSAWRLAHASTDEVAAIRTKIGGEGPLRISVFECSDRIGGRLLSASPGTMPGVTMELGGMRYLNTQPLVKGLVEKKLKDVKRHPQAVDEPDNFAYLRGRLFRQSELDQPGTDLPYGITETERMVLTGADVSTPAELIFWAVYQEFPEIKGMKPEKLEEFLSTAKVEGKELWKVGFWNLLSRHLSHEGRELAITTIGYDVLGANANAVDVIAENFDFTSDTEYFLFDDGFESVVWKLAEELEQAGGTITTNRTLEGFDDADAGDGFVLEFESGDPIEARAVVLAMPQAALKALRRQGPLLDPDKAPDFPTILNSVQGIPLYKLFLIYDTPWWNEEWELTEGRSLTDIPVRQCYYWSTNVGEPSAVMAYNDQASTSFWGGFQLGPLGPGDTGLAMRESMLFQPQRSEEQEQEPDDEVAQRRRKNWNAHKAPHEMVMEMHRQLMEMHGVTDAPKTPKPIDAAFMDWMNAPFGGAVHFWNPGHESSKVHRDMTQPRDDLNVFIVGEAYSTAQTWVEGAFQTSEIFLQERLGMQVPDWLLDLGL